MTNPIRPLRLAGLFVPLALALLAPAPAARADHLDPPLVGHASRVLNALRDEKVQNVGVLPFRVKKGNRPESFIAGPINIGMTTRVENALIMVEDPKQSAIGVIRDAAGTASRAKVGAWYTNEAERKKLFDVSYNLAWGDRKVKADAFLTGLIENTGDRETVKVTIQAFFKKDPRKLVEVARFTCDSDRALFSDLGYNFVLPRSALVKHRSPASRDKAVASLVKRRDEGQPPIPGEVQPGTPEDTAGLATGVLYNSSPIEIKPISEGTQGEYFIPPIKTGTTFQLLLTYNGKAQGKIGAIVKVNGESTWRQERGESINLRKWLYSPEKSLNKADVFNGYYIQLEGKNVLPFQVLTAEQSLAHVSQLGDRVGWIDIDVFHSGTPSTVDDRMIISTRGMAARGADGKFPRKAATLVEAQNQLYAANHVHKRKVRGRDQEGGLLAPAGIPKEDLVILEGMLPNPILVGSIHIKYYDPGQTPMKISSK